MSKQVSKSSDPANEGEGNRTADRHYREAASKHATKPEAKQAADEAEEAIDDDEESEELERAEQIGKSKAKGPASR